MLTLYKVKAPKYDSINVTMDFSRREERVNIVGTAEMLLREGCDLRYAPCRHHISKHIPLLTAWLIDGRFYVGAKHIALDHNVSAYFGGGPPRGTQVRHHDPLPLVKLPF